MVALPGKRRVFGYLIALVLLCAGAESADAKKYRIRIDSKPRGATVLLGDGTKLGKTPLRTRIDRGEHVIIVRKSGYVETVETISVKRNNQRFRLSLERAEIGEIRVISKKRGVLDDAAIFVDGKEVGTVPDTIEVAAGARQVEVRKDGFESFDEWVEVSAGKKVEVKAFAMSTGARNSNPFNKGEGGDEEGDDDDIGDDDDDEEVAAVDEEEEVAGAVSAGAKVNASRPPGSLAVIRAGIDFGGRRFRYEQPMTSNLRPYDAFPFPVGRLAAELYPLGFSSSALARGLGLTAAIGFGFPLNSETPGDMPVAVATTWRDWSVGGRYRFAISSTLALALAGTYGKRSFNFDDEETDIAGEVPDVDYDQIALGADLETAVTGSIDLVLGARFILLSGFGELGERFDVSSSTGLGGILRFEIGLSDRIDLLIEGSYQRATLTLEMSDAAFVAEGGTDQFLGGMLGLGLNL